MAIEWTGLYANTGYSSANNKTQDDAVLGMQDTLYVTGPGYGAYEAIVRLHNSTGAIVATVNISGGGGAVSAPPPARFLDNDTVYSYSLEVVRGLIPTEDAQKIVIRLVGGASKRFPSPMSTTPQGDVVFRGAVTSGKNKVRLRAHLPRRVRIAHFGYSIDNAYSITTANLERLVATIPGGATPTAVSVNATRLGVVNLTKNVQYVGNCGVPGETVAQMLARSSVASSATRKSLYDCIALRPDVVFLTGPLVNDAQTWTEATTLANVDTVVDGAFQIIRYLSRYIPHVAFAGCLGISPAGLGGSAAAALYIQSLTDYAVKKLAILCSGIDGVYFLDPEGNTCDRQAWKANYSADGIHPGILGGLVWSQMALDLLESLFDVTNADPVVYDFDKDWFTVVSNRPTGVSAPSAFNGAVVGASSTVSGVWRQAFTTTSAADSGLYFEVTTIKNALQSLPMLSGGSWYMEYDFELLDASGALAKAWSTQYSTALYNAANDVGTYNPSRGKGLVVDRASYCTDIFQLDRDASGLGSSTKTRVTITAEAAGSWTLVVYPPKLRKYVSGLGA